MKTLSEETRDKEREYIKELEETERSLTVNIGTTRAYLLKHKRVRMFSIALVYYVTGTRSHMYMQPSSNEEIKRK